MTRPNDVQAAFEALSEFNDHGSTQPLFDVPKASMDALIAYIESLEKAAEWRTDMENAPRNGDTFLAATWYDSLDGLDTPFICEWRKSWVDKGFVNVHNLVAGIKGPTHWRPLPTPPEAK